MKATHSKAVKIQRMIFYISIYLEILLAFIVIIAIGSTLLSVPLGLLVLCQGGGFNNFLQALFDIIIGIELLKMLCRHDLDSVVEVLMFAVAREMVINHMPIIETLIGIIAIAVLFSIKKIRIGCRGRWTSGREKRDLFLLAEITLWVSGMCGSVRLS